jgi:hypothetical protein
VYFDTGYLAQQIAAAEGIPVADVAAFGLFTEPTQPQPFFSPDAMDYLVGPPAVPFFNDGTFPTGFAGYSPGFTVFETTPTVGTYNLSVLVPAQNASPVTYTASASLTGTTLGPTSVTFTRDGSGGGSGTVTVPAGVTETLVYVVDVHISSSGSASALFYAVGPLTGTGSVAYTLPDNLGPCIGTGCQNGSGASPTLGPSSSDLVFVSAVGYDYPAFEAGPPGNKQQKPTIANASGQADITMSPIGGPF